jgi:hypothetical protein
MGNGVTGSAAISNIAGPDSASGSPAIPQYVTEIDGKLVAVTEDYWPGDPL